MDKEQLLKKVISKYLKQEINEWNYIEINNHRFAVKVVTG